MLGGSGAELQSEERRRGAAAEGGSEWRKMERAGAYMVEAFGTG